MLSRSSHHFNRENSHGERVIAGYMVTIAFLYLVGQMRRNNFGVDFLRFFKANKIILIIFIIINDFFGAT